MPRLTKNVTGVNATAMTQNGEVKVHITLELLINLDSDGISVQAKAAPKETEVDVDESGKLVVPIFTNADRIENLGETK